MWSRCSLVVCVAVSSLVGVYGCQSLTRPPRAPWTVQRVEPPAAADSSRSWWPPRAPWSVQQVEPRHAIAAKSASPQLAVPRSTTVPQPSEKVVPNPTVDPQAKVGTNFSNEVVVRAAQPPSDAESRSQPTLRFKPAPRDRPFESSDSETSLPSKSESPSTVRGPRFEALDAPKDSPLQLEVSGLKQKTLGETVTFDVTVYNDSQRELEKVVVHVDFDEPLSFPGHAEKRLLKDVGTLSPGESRAMQLTLEGQKAGRHACRFVVEADGEEVAKHTAIVQFVPQKSAGPKRNSLGSRGGK